MPAKVHPADYAAAALIARADRYEIALFRGRGAYAKAKAATLDDARAAAVRLEAEAANGKRALIYALTAEGRSALVTPATLKAMEAIMATTTKKNSAPAKKAEAKPSAEAPKRKRIDYAQLEAEARKGRLPAPPDFSAPTHARFRARLDALTALAKAGDVEALRAVDINPVSSSPRAMARYRDLCVTALEAEKKGRK